MDTDQKMGEVSDSTPKHRGRQRSIVAEAAILKATLSLLKRRSLADITADEIAARAKVSKATIYKWWPNKNRVALDAILSRAQVDVPIPNTGSALGDFTEYFKAATKFYNSSLGQAALQFLAASQSDPALLTLFRVHFQSSRRAGLKIMIDRAVARGEIRPDLQIDLIIDLLFGPVVYRLLAGHAPVDDSIATSIISTVFQGICA